MAHSAHEQLKIELYRAALLLGADEMLLKAIQAWREGVPVEDVVADVGNWNEAKALEMEEWLPNLHGRELDAARHKLKEYRENWSGE